MNINEWHVHNFGVAVKFNFNNEGNLKQIRKTGLSLLGNQFDNTTLRDECYNQFEALINDVTKRIDTLMNDTMGCE